MNDWANFFIATAGASAALTGLVFVGISINLTKILSIAGLPGRALLSIILLLNTLVVSLLMLVPRQSTAALGWWLTAVSVCTWAAALTLDIRVLRRIARRYKPRYAGYFLADQVATLLFIGAGIALAAGWTGGAYVMLPAILLSIVKAVADGWVLLVEINR